VLPQIPLTLTNAIIVTAAVSRRRFPKELHPVNERNLGSKPQDYRDAELFLVLLSRPRRERQARSPPNRPCALETRRRQIAGRLFPAIPSGDSKTGGRRRL
jgi:hypothetical protein